MPNEFPSADPGTFVAKPKKKKPVKKTARRPKTKAGTSRAKKSVKKPTSRRTKTKVGAKKPAKRSISRRTVKAGKKKVFRESRMVPGRDLLMAAELFAGVGGFRIGLESTKGGSWKVAWSNQWEPGRKNQFASDCYVQHFGSEGHVNDDIAKALDQYESGEREIPDVDMLVGGFPCQDYSVAKPLNQAAGLVGKKGVLWWQIYRFLELKKKAKKPVKYILLENVDRLLKSPGGQRGRDFAIILACLDFLGYEVEWRVVNAADYGFPQRRRRVFIAATQKTKGVADAVGRITESGILARALPCESVEGDLFSDESRITLEKDIPKLSSEFGKGQVVSQFRNAGFMKDRKVWTFDVAPKFAGKKKVLSDIIEQDDVVDASFFVSEGQVPKWKYLKGAKNEERIHKASGTAYYYTEGALPFPDPLDRPARTILTAEGGSSPSRFKHLIRTPEGRYRRLTPRELERANGFPDDWTATGMSDGQRAFCMGNALVIGVVERIGGEIAERAREARASGAVNGKARKDKQTAA